MNKLKEFHIKFHHTGNIKDDVQSFFNTLPNLMNIELSEEYLGKKCKIVQDT